MTVIGEVRRRAMAALLPPLRPPLSEWIEANVRLPEGLAAVPGPIRLYPYQRGIADSIGDPTVERVTVVKAARVGFSALLTAALGNYVANDPAPILVLLPTEADARDYTRMLTGTGTLVTAIPNALPWPVGSASQLTSKTVVSAGRLVEQKGFDRLIEAFAPVASAYPDWQLHIYGTGGQGPQLRRLVGRLGLHDHVHFKGYSDSFRDVLQNASVYALGSRFEGFGMVLIEAMSVGLPLVSFDCPRGPGEIIDDGVTGKLVPDGDVSSFTAALLELVASDSLRRRMGANAREGARAYEMPGVVDRWETLFAALSDARG